MDVIKLYDNFRVPYQTEGHKHCREGWVNTPCPFCKGSPGLHLGTTLNGQIWYCWRCGWKPVKKAVAGVLGVTEQRAAELIRQYGGIPKRQPKETKRKVRKKSHLLPPGTTMMQTQHKKYLKKRGFDPHRIYRLWGVMGTGPSSKLDKTNYKHRILAPIYWNNQRVSFQTRDITGRHPVKYLACPEERELIHHKHILYGRPDKWGDIGICVEGITDVWRLGPIAFATFGIEYTRRQVRQMAKNFSKIVVLFDSEPQAQSQADKLISELLLRGVEAWKETIATDPADLTNKEAKKLKNSIMK